MDITRQGSLPPVAGPADYFTGDVEIACPFCGSGNLSGATVTFQPGARTAWHTHPLGQTLLVTDGIGRIGRWGGDVQEIRTGDKIWIEPGEKHWHGAAPTTAMTHVAICEMKDGKAVDWMEQVSDEDYTKEPR